MLTVSITAKLKRDKRLANGVAYKNFKRPCAISDFKFVISGTFYVKLSTSDQPFGRDGAINGGQGTI